MSEWAEIVKAFASLLWPILAFTFLFIYKDQLKDLMKRIKKGKLLGQEIELEEQLHQLESSAVELSYKVATLTQTNDNHQEAFT